MAAEALPSVWVRVSQLTPQTPPTREAAREPEPVKKAVFWTGVFVCFFVLHAWFGTYPMYYMYYYYVRRSSTTQPRVGLGLYRLRPAPVHSVVAHARFTEPTAIEQPPVVAHL